MAPAFGRGARSTYLVRLLLCYPSTTELSWTIQRIKLTGALRSLSAPIWLCNKQLTDAARQFDKAPGTSANSRTLRRAGTSFNTTGAAHCLSPAPGRTHRAPAILPTTWPQRGKAGIVVLYSPPYRANEGRAEKEMQDTLWNEAISSF